MLNDCNVQLGFGMMRLPMSEGEIDINQARDMIDEYMKGDFCYFDTHPAYMNHRADSLVNELVVKRYSRERFFLADKMPYYVKSTEDYERIFNEELEKCGVTYFDFYLLHALSKEIYSLHTKLGGFDFLCKKKEQGFIKHIGFSFHDSPEVLEQILSEHPEVEFVQLQINYFDWEDSVIQSKKCYGTARKYNKPVFVMEPIKGGSLANQIDIDEKLDLPDLALKFVASLPGVKVILSGMNEVSHVIKNRNTLANSRTGPIDKSLYDQIIREIRKNERIQCTSCRYCENECPKNIVIPDIISLMNACSNVGKNDRTFIGRYRMIYSGYVRNKGKAGDCIQCGKCENRCPQKITIREHMKTAKKMFEPMSKEEKMQMKYNIVRDLFKLVQKGCNFDEYFMEHKYKVIAIYGLGDIGILFCNELKKSSIINISYGIDTNCAKREGIDFPVIDTKDIKENVDVIVVTAAFEFGLIASNLSEKTTSPIVSINEILSYFLET